MNRGYRRPDAIVSTEALERRLDEPGLRIYDCTTYLDPPTPGIAAPYAVRSGRADYEREHVPGAAFLDLQGELSDHNSPSHLRFTLPPLEQLRDAFAARGVGDDTHVVLYSRASVQWSTRVWWMLRAVGFDGAAVLDGGLDKWLAEGRPVVSGVEAYPASELSLQARAGLFVGRDRVLAAVSEPSVAVINALSPDLHRGENPRYGRPGRIPGSTNVPALSLIDASDKTFLDAETVSGRLRAAGADAGGETIVYCGGGIAATVDAFLLHQLGHERVAVYDDSMSEWARDESLPIEKD